MNQPSFVDPTSKTFWTGVAAIGFGVVLVIRQEYETGIESILAGLAMIFLRHAVAKSK